jgi:hypothetical protein
LHEFPPIYAQAACLNCIDGKSLQKDLRLPDSRK